jgi:Tol biopolymer transport system component
MRDRVAEQALPATRSGERRWWLLLAVTYLTGASACVAELAQPETGRKAKLVFPTDRVVSPRGEKVAFVEVRADRSAQIHIVDVAHPNLARVIPAPGGTLHVQWAPGGRTLVAEAYHEGATFDYHIVTASTGSPLGLQGVGTYPGFAVVTTAKGGPMAVAYFADAGSPGAESGEQPSDAYHVCLTSEANGQRRIEGTAGASPGHLASSPDGRRLLFAHKARWKELDLWALGEPTILFADTEEGWALTGPSYSPDSRYVVDLAIPWDWSLVGDSATEQSTRVFVYDRTTGQERLLPERSPAVKGICWGSDGTSLVCLDRENAVVVLDVRSGSVVAGPTSIGEGDWQIQGWSPAASELIVSTSTRVASVNVEKGEVRVLYDADEGL